MATLPDASWFNPTQLDGWKICDHIDPNYCKVMVESHRGWEEMAGGWKDRGLLKEVPPKENH